MTAIIFGATGQDGHYLAKLLSGLGYEVIGVSRSGNFLHKRLSDFTEISTLIKDTRPQYIFHLAANSTTKHTAWRENHETINTGAVNIMESVLQFSPDTKMFFSGSGLQFVNTNRPIKETDEFAPTSSYAVSRIASVYAARYYRSLGLKAYIGYFFNHDSPLRTDRHINKKITATVQRIFNGKANELVIGDLSVKKEFGFAGDIVEGIWTLVQQDNVFEATIGTGEAFAIKDWVKYCFSKFGLNWEDYVRESGDYKADYEVLVSDPSTIHALGWHHKTSFTQLADLMLQE